MDNTVDSLQIDIVQSASAADKSLDALVSSLKKLDRIGKSNSFSIIQKQLRSIAGVKFDKLESQISSITKNIKELKSYKDFLKNIELGTPTIDTTTVTTSVDTIVEEVNRAREEVITVGETFGETVIMHPDRLDYFQGQCDSIIDSYKTYTNSINSTKDKILNMLAEKKTDFENQSSFIGATNFVNDLEDKIKKLDLSASLLIQRMEQLKESGNIDATSWQNLQKQLLNLKLQYSQLEQSAQKHSRAVDLLGKSVEKTKKPLGKLIAQFGRVAMYRAIRMVLSQIMSALKEGIQNAAKFSEEANQIMSGYKTESLYIKNSLGSALLPILQTILPTVIRIGDGFADIANSIGLIGAWINGEDTFLKATKYAQNYKKSLDDVKRASVGFDEINVLSKVDTNNDYTKMFEEVDINGWDIAGSIAKITALVASITALIMMIKGVKLGDVFTKMGKGIKTAWTYLKNASGWKKAGISIAALAAEAAVCYTSFYDAAKGTQSWGNALLAVIPTIALVGAAMYSMFGVVGIVFAAVVALVSALSGLASARNEMIKNAAMEKFFTNEGIAIDKVTTSLQNYFASIGINKQQELNEELAIAKDSLIDARFAYDSFWNTIKNSETLNTTQIETLSEAFANLAEATNNLNNAAIESFMASLKTGIEMNITPELTTRLEGLVGTLQTAQDLISVKVNGLNSEYQSILNDVASGKMSVEEAMPKLNSLREQMNNFTLTDNSYANAWNSNLDIAKQNGINAGTNQEVVKSAIEKLASDRDSYLTTLSVSYENSRDVLRRLIEIDQSQFGGALGFSESDFDVLEQNYNAQVKTVTEQYNEVLKTILDNFKSKAEDYDSWWLDIGILDGIADVGMWITGLFGDDAAAKKALAKEQKEFMEWLATLIIPTHANGGFPEDGLFMANHTELVGKFTNGKTAVANNAQIVEGIKQGVIEAMSESGGNDGGNWVIQIVDTDGNVKGETIITAAERKNRRDGKTVIAVGG